MGKKIFSAKAEAYLKNEMCICLDDLTNKILNDAPNSLSFFKELIDFMINLDNPDTFEYEATNFIEKYNLPDDSSTFKIKEEIYHAFRSFKRGGLLNLYIARGAEFWYPKIIINKNIGSRKNIDNLSNKVSIYRGTSLDEFNSSKFSQSWTLDENIAYNFAFIHYQGFDDYVNTTRIVIKAKINKSDIYYYKKYSEEEVIINPSKLILKSIEAIEKKVLDDE